MPGRTNIRWKNNQIIQKSPIKEKTENMRSNKIPKKKAVNSDELLIEEKTAIRTFKGNEMHVARYADTSATDLSLFVASSGTATTSKLSNLCNCRGKASKTDLKRKNTPNASVIFVIFEYGRKYEAKNIDSITE